ncbi:DUF2726 domain-containing protein [Zooshikella sp. RANM57]|uniref:DUF2726 domain-containing protein n=1 Tax=Zooshikella sp. RANM57 TaxID=3425863 RepID=UPI003D70015B
MEWIVLAVVMLVVLAFFSKSAGDRGFKAGVERYNSYQSPGYHSKGALFTPAERSFLGVLDQAVPNGVRVFGKVRVADVINPAKGLDHKSWKTAFFKISSKHFDYVLCSEDNFRVIAVVELDDKSHNNERAVKRDELINKACESAGLVLIRFKAKSGYQVQTVRDQIMLALNPG